MADRGLADGIAEERAGELEIAVGTSVEPISPKNWVLRLQPPCSANASASTSTVVVVACGPPPLTISATSAVVWNLRNGQLGSIATLPLEGPTGFRCGRPLILPRPHGRMQSASPKGRRRDTQLASWPRPGMACHLRNSDAAAALLAKQDTRAEAEDVEQFVEIAVGDDQACRRGVVSDQGRIVRAFNHHSLTEHDHSPALP